MNQVISNKKEILVDGEKLSKYKNIFAEYDDIEQIPSYQSITSK